jgi:hypothetical protein
MISFLETYDYLHFHFNSFFIFNVHASIAHYQQTSLVPSMFIFYYRQQVLITLQSAQVMVIL